MMESNAADLTKFPSGGNQKAPRQATRDLTLEDFFLWLASRRSIVAACVVAGLLGGITLGALVPTKKLATTSLRVGGGSIAKSSKPEDYLFESVGLIKSRLEVFSEEWVLQHPGASIKDISTDKATGLISILGQGRTQADANEVTTAALKSVLDRHDERYKALRKIAKERYSSLSEDMRKSKVQYQQLQRAANSASTEASKDFAGLYWISAYSQVSREMSKLRESLNHYKVAIDTDLFLRPTAILSPLKEVEASSNRRILLYGTAGLLLGIAVAMFAAVMNAARRD